MSSPKIIKCSFRRGTRFLILAVAAFSMVSAVSAQRGRSILPGAAGSPVRAISSDGASVPVATPTGFEVINGELTCKGLSQRDLTDNVVGGREQTLEFQGPFSGVFDFRTYTTDAGQNVVLIGTVPTTPPGTNTVSASSTGVLSFQSQKNNTAVMVFDGLKTFTYYYNYPGIGYTNSGGNLTTDGNPFVRIRFCFQQPLNQTAADVLVSGRVTNRSGSGIAGARVTITNAATGETSLAITNPFGYYVSPELESGVLYVASVSRRGMTFETPSRSFTLTDNLTDLDFVALD